MAPVLAPEQLAETGLNLVLLGGPGSGKGTQAEELHAKFSLAHIATGDLFREHLSAETDLGKLAGRYINRGELVPDDITEAMVEERLQQPDTRAGFILDGFPRTLAQAEALADILAQLHRRVSSVVYISVADQEIVTRLAGRRICRDCQTPYHLTFNPPAQASICDLCGGELYQRDDDNPQTISRRLQSFYAQTAPLIHYYRAAGLLLEIDGQGEVEVVKQRTVAATRSLMQANHRRGAHHEAGNRRRPCRFSAQGRGRRLPDGAGSRGRRFRHTQCRAGRLPDIARLVCAAVRGGSAERGILVCGTGVGACIAANKIRGIRAAVCHDTYSAHQAVEHDDVNVVCVGAWIAGIRVVEEVLHAFLAAEFSTDEEFRRRVDKLGVLEREAANGQSVSGANRE